MKTGFYLCWLTVVLAVSAPGLGQTVPVPDTIRAEGVPPVPAAVGQALNRYQNIRPASFQGWASDGSEMYIITRFADVSQVHFVAEPGGRTRPSDLSHPNPLPVGARAMSGSYRRGEREYTGFSTSPLWGEVGRRPGEGAAPMIAGLHLDTGIDIAL
jgi:hypothetical protein